MKEESSKSPLIITMSFYRVIIIDGSRRSILIGSSFLFFLYGKDDSTRPIDDIISSFPSFFLKKTKKGRR
jgi:hypothetical protein